MDKETLLNVTRVITHANCPDGIISAAIIRQVLPRVSVEFCQYNTPQTNNLQVTPGMLFVDFTPPPRLVDACIDAGAIVLDHHKGQEETIKRFGERGVFADERSEPGVSGATLAYREVYSALDALSNADVTMFSLMRLIGVRDTWQKNAPEWELACAVSAAVTHMGEDYWLTHGPRIEAIHCDIGRACLRQRHGYVERALRQLFVFEHNDIKVAVFSDTNGVISDVGEEIRKRKIADVTCGFFYTRNEGQGNEDMTLVYSLRSNYRFDVAEFAKTLGGGGHTRAAGFSVPAQLLSDSNPYRNFQDEFTSC